MKKILTSPIFIICIIAVIAVACYFIFRKKDDKKDDSKTDGKPKSEPDNQKEESEKLSKATGCLNHKRNNFQKTF